MGLGLQWSMLSKVLIFLCLAVILGVPLGVRLASSEAAPPADARRLVIITPHVPQIRLEFAEAFDRWHRRVHGKPVIVDYRTPGGTSDILKVLEAQYGAAIKEGKVDLTDPANPLVERGAIAFDLMFGGGTFDHGRLKTGVPSGQRTSEGRAIMVPMSTPAGFAPEQLTAWFGENRIGAGQLYDPQQFWIGTALSSFGIVYNKDLLRERNLPEPTGFGDLADPRLQNLLILADPRQSGSVTTAIDAILNAALWNTARDEGWESELNAAFDAESAARRRGETKPWESQLSAQRMESVERAFDAGWRLLREISANARTYTAAATRPPVDIGAGEGAAGLAIDFYGRGQAQAIVLPGQDPLSSRVGYVDPVGATYIDADPASILRGGPDPELAKRFIEFCLTDEAQAMWQFSALREARAASNPRGADGEPMGPRAYDLRRMPVRRSMYREEMFRHFIDKVDPFAIASTHRPANWRAGIGVMMGAFSIDVALDQRAAWKALNQARGQAGFDAQTLAAMERAFYAWPTTPTKEGELPFTAANFRAIREAWRDQRAMPRIEIRYTTFFRDQYREVMRLARQGGAS